MVLLRVRDRNQRILRRHECLPCSLRLMMASTQMAKAVDTRLKRARYHWENRRKKEAERLGRDTKETLEWKIFPDAVKVRLLAPTNDVPHCMWGAGVRALVAWCWPGHEIEPRL